MNKKTERPYLILLYRDGSKDASLLQIALFPRTVYFNFHLQLTILPIRVAFLGELPLVLASLLNHIQYTLGNQGAPFEAIGAQILVAIERATALPISGKSTEEEASVAGMQSLFEATEAVGAPLPQADPRLVPLLELETGTIKLDSPFYIRRQSDDEMLQQVSRVGTTTVVKGPRQMGKSSLLARAMAVAQQNQQNALYRDFQFVVAITWRVLKACCNIFVANSLALSKPPQNRMSSGTTRLAPKII